MWEQSLHIYVYFISNKNALPIIHTAKCQGNDYIIIANFIKVLVKRFVQ